MEFGCYENGECLRVLHLTRGVFAIIVLPKNSFMCKVGQYASFLSIFNSDTFMCVDEKMSNLEIARINQVAFNRDSLLAISSENKIYLFELITDENNL